MLPPQSEAIALRILSLRGQRVLLDADLAALYDVPTGQFNQAVKRNAEKFPVDFMFRLTAEEFANLKSQIVISSSGHGGRRKLPIAFTEHGALMAATILNTSRAVEVSVYVVRAFVQLRSLAVEHTDLDKRLKELEGKTEALAMRHDAFSQTTRTQLKQVFDAIRELMRPPDPPKRPIGFVVPAPSTKNKGGEQKTESQNGKQDC